MIHALIEYHKSALLKSMASMIGFAIQPFSLIFIIHVAGRGQASRFCLGWGPYVALSLVWGWLIYP